MTGEEEFFKALDKVSGRAHKPKEKTLEAQLREWVLAQGWLYIKNEGTRDFPDRLVIGPGWTAFLELKRKGYLPRAGQMRTMTELRALNQNADWSSDLEYCKEYLTDINNEQQRKARH